MFAEVGEFAVERFDVLGFVLGLKLAALISGPLELIRFNC
jgi:hypothetical protein